LLHTLVRVTLGRGRQVLHMQLSSHKRLWQSYRWQRQALFRRFMHKSKRYEGRWVDLLFVFAQQCRRR